MPLCPNVLSILLFLSIFQVMAIATLAELTDNQRVFKGVVKIRKGLGARLMLAVKDMSALKVAIAAQFCCIFRCIALIVSLYVCCNSFPFHSFPPIHLTCARSVFSLCLPPPILTSFTSTVFVSSHLSRSLLSVADVVPRLWSADPRQAARGGRLHQAHPRAARLAG